MSSTVRATAQNETPAFFPAGRETLFGILTAPTGEALGTAVVLIPGGAGTQESVNRNRMWVNLARRAAALGYHAFRFDFHGAGESTGSEGRLRLDRPFVDDVTGAVRWIEGQGVSNIILVGSCYGARTALSVAEHIPGLRGLVMAAAYPQDMAQGERAATLMAVEWTFGQYVQRSFSRETLKGILDRERRGVYWRVVKAKARQVAARIAGRRRGTAGASPTFLNPLAALVDRKVPLLFIYGDEDDAYRVFERARKGRMGSLLERAGTAAEVALLRGRIHGLNTVRMQDAALDRIEVWLRELRTNDGHGDGSVR
jgi:pimeloyl-ACP methyl ester carboxylesterase